MSAVTQVSHVAHVTHSHTETVGKVAQVLETGGHTFRADAIVSESGEGSAPGPHDLFDASLAACMTLTAHWYARHKDIPLERVTCTLERDESGERAKPPEEPVYKQRVGARVTKRYHAPETPCARLLQSDLVPEAVKERLRAVAITLDPLRLLDEIRGAQHQLARIAAGEKLHLPARSGADLDQFLKTLATAWHVGEVRPTHAKLPKPVRHWRTRTDAFAEAWPRILLWLDADPDTASSEVLDRLQAEHPGQYPDDLLRTLQRRLKAWRQASARRLVFPPELELGHARGQGERPSLRSTARMTTRGTRSG